LRRGLFVISIGMAFASASMAGEHYVEFWNPPEVHRNAHKLARRLNRPVNHQTSSAGGTRLPRTAKRRVSAASGSGKRMAFGLQIKRRRTFDDIPRQVTPEGNILRVSHTSASSASRRAGVCGLEQHRWCINRSARARMKFCVPSVAPPGLVALSEKDIHTLRDFARGRRIYRTMLIDGSSKALRSLQNAMYLPSAVSFDPPESEMPAHRQPNAGR
jgi:hypothetical protein